MFGRDLTEQVHADSRDEERQVPVIVEKCIDAVEALGMQSMLCCLTKPDTLSTGLRGYLPQDRRFRAIKSDNPAI